MPVTGYLIATDGSAASPDSQTVRRLLAAGELLWLDLHQPSEDELDLLTTVFGIHPLAAAAVGRPGG